MPTNTSRTYIAFMFFKNQFDLDDKKYETVVNRNKTNGLSGGRPRNPKKPKETQETQSVILKPKKADNDNVNDTDIDNDNVNEKNTSQKSESVPAFTSDRLQDHRPTETKNAEPPTILPSATPHDSIKPANELLARLLADKRKMDGMYINLRSRFPKENKTVLDEALPLLLESYSVKFDNVNPAGSNYQHFCTALSKWLAETKMLPYTGEKKTDQSTISPTSKYKNLE